MDTYVELGYTKKAHGLTGAIKVHVHDQYLEDFLKADILFIEKNKQKVPFFIEQVMGDKDLIVKFEDVNIKEDTKGLLSKTLFLRASDVIAEEEREMEQFSLEYSFCEGFEILNEEQELIGTVKEVLEFPQQEMAVVLFKGNEVFIPLHPDLIIEIDKPTKKMIVKIPDGLLELYE